MKIAAVCGSGLGSSFMVEMNIKTVLSNLGIPEGTIEVTHSDVGSADQYLADVFFVGTDLADSLNHLGDVRVLDSIIDIDELTEKVESLLVEKGFL